VFAAITALRRYAYQIGLLRKNALPVPVIVVGNINMGGSGKTPVVMWLVEQLKKNGYNPGVISRGYRANRTQPTSVTPESPAADVGDEPLLIVQRTGCPVWIGKDRVSAGLALLQANPDCDVIISDDGLQHYRLQRAVEIAVVDQQSIDGHYLLPAGPLREPQSRLNTVDAVICHGQKTIATAYEMQLQGHTFYNLKQPAKTMTAAEFKGKVIKALAGIGQPERFFNTLAQLGLDFEGVPFADHHAFTAQDLAAIQCEALVMTEKDAVKCKAFAQDHYWVLPVEATIEPSLLPMIIGKMKAVQKT
jgi:tetraacyldisaccharide 4'-kinase